MCESEIEAELRDSNQLSVRYICLYPLTQLLANEKNRWIRLFITMSFIFGTLFVWVVDLLGCHWLNVPIWQCVSYHHKFQYQKFLMRSTINLHLSYYRRFWVSLSSPRLFQHEWYSIETNFLSFRKAMKKIADLYDSDAKIASLENGHAFYWIIDWIGRYGIKQNVNGFSSWSEKYKNRWINAMKCFSIAKLLMFERKNEWLHSVCEIFNPTNWTVHLALCRQKSAKLTHDGIHSSLEDVKN